MYMQKYAKYAIFHISDPTYQIYKIWSLLLFMVTKVRLGRPQAAVLAVTVPVTNKPESS